MEAQHQVILHIPGQSRKTRARHQPGGENHTVAGMRIVAEEVVPSLDIPACERLERLEPRLWAATRLSWWHWTRLAAGNGL